MMKIGSHVGNSGDLMLEGSVKEALSYNANCFMVYLGPPQSTIRKDISRLKINEMKELLEINNIDINDVIINAPYIFNLAQPDNEKRMFAVDFITKEMQNMALVGAKYMVIHPGAHMKNGIDNGLELIADSLKKILEKTKNDNTVILIETMAGKGTECCSKFEEIKKLIDLTGSKRIGVCFDTCHVHDSGYDIIYEYEKVLKEFDEIIGLDYIKVIHLNDSLNDCGTHKDRHANIGFGKIGFNTLLKFALDPRFNNIPKILETPYIKNGDDSYPPYFHEIKMLKSEKFNDNLINEILNERR